MTEVPMVHGTHCAGIGCEHDELAGSGLEAVAPNARTTARHRRSSSGRRVRMVSLQLVHSQHAHDRDALLG
jgi:hypothetical protein